MKISKWFKYQKPTKSLKKEQGFKYIYLSYNRYNNGNAEIYFHLLGANLVIYINGLKEEKENFKLLIKH